VSKSLTDRSCRFIQCFLSFIVPLGLLFLGFRLVSDGPLLHRRFQLSLVLPEQMVHILLGFHHSDRAVLLPMGLLQPISCILCVGLTQNLPLGMKFRLVHALCFSGQFPELRQRRIQLSLVLRFRLFQPLQGAFHGCHPLFHILHTFVIGFVEAAKNHSLFAAQFLNVLG